MPQILDTGSVRLSNADVLAWIATKRAQTKSETASDKASGLPKSFLADNFQRSLRKHERELASRKYPYTDNPGAYSDANRIRAISVFSQQVDERIVFPAEDALRATMREEGKEEGVVEKAVQGLWEKKALTETEHLQVYNLAPNAVEMLQNFLVDWEERFSGEEMDELVAIVGQVYRCGEIMPGDEGMEIDEQGGGVNGKAAKSTSQKHGYKQAPHDMPIVERPRPTSQGAVLIEAAVAKLMERTKVQKVPDPNECPGQGPKLLDFAGIVTFERRKLANEARSRLEATHRSPGKQPGNSLDQATRSSTSPAKRSSPVKQLQNFSDRTRRSSTSPRKRSVGVKQTRNSLGQGRPSSTSPSKRTTCATTCSQTSSQPLKTQQVSSSQHHSFDGAAPHFPFNPPRAPAAHYAHHPSNTQPAYTSQHPSSDRPAYSDPPHHAATFVSDPTPQCGNGSGGGDVDSSWHERLQRSSLATLKATVPLPADEPSAEESFRARRKAEYAEMVARQIEEDARRRDTGAEDRYTGVTTGFMGPKNANATPLGERKKRG